MDPNPKSHPVLSYVLARTPSLSGRHAAAAAAGHVLDIEQPSSPQKKIVNQMPHLSHPTVIASMASAVTDVAQTRAVLKRLGTRPDHEAVDHARAKIAEIDAEMVKKLEDIVLSPRPTSEARVDWRARLAEKEKACREEAERQKSEYKAVISLEEMHVAYDRLLKSAEERLVGLYDTAAREKEEGGKAAEDEVNEEVVGVLKKGLGTGVLDRVDLSGSRLRILPEAFGKIQSLVSVNLSNNQLEELPDSIGGLVNLEEFNLYSNLLETLPDSIGLLHNLKILNVSGNKLIALPDTISHCRSLVELDVSFNNLTYLPTNIGCELSNLQKLSIQLNKIRSLPTSFCEMRSLKYLDAHFNELRGLPPHFGKLTNLQTLNLASNFADLRELPLTFGDLTNLRELDLSNNQIHALPYTFGGLTSLVKLNVDQNPIVVPPLEVVQQGAEAVRVFMGKKWIEMLEEEEKGDGKEEGDDGWVSRGTKWLTRTVSNVSDSVSGYLGSPKSPKEQYLDQRL